MARRHRPPEAGRCGFCNKPLTGEPKTLVVLGRRSDEIRFCSQNCLESYAEIELGRRVSPVAHPHA